MLSIMSPRWSLYNSITFYLSGLGDGSSWHGPTCCSRCSVVALPSPPHTQLIAPSDFSVGWQFQESSSMASRWVLVFPSFCRTVHTALFLSVSQRLTLFLWITCLQRWSGSQPERGHWLARSRPSSSPLVRWSWQGLPIGLETGGSCRWSSAPHTSCSLPTAGQ